MACGLALALAWACTWAAGQWEAGATQVFRRAGLPGTFLPTTMLQDRSGMVWIGTQSGLIRWDGYRAHRFAPGNLPASEVSDLHEDSTGRLWAATEGGGLAWFDVQTGSFTTVGWGEAGFSSTAIPQVAPDGQDALWVATGRGLNRYDITTGVVQREPKDGLPTGLPAGSPIDSMLLDRRGDLWAATPEGLFRLRAGGSAFRAVPLPVQQASHLTLGLDGDGRLWIGTDANGIFVREPEAGTIRQVMDTAQGGKVPLDINLSRMQDAGNGEMWLGSWGQGIVKVNTTDWSIRRVRHDAKVKASLATDFVSVLFRDRSGLMWAGGNGGLDTTDPNQHAISTWFGGAGQLIGGPTPYVSSILARPDGSVWLGSGHGGVDIIAPGQRGPRRRLEAQAGRPLRALPAATVLSMANAPDGRAYIGTTKGLYVADETGRRVEWLQTAGMPPAESAFALCHSGDRLWFSTGFGGRYLDLSSSPPTLGAAVGIDDLAVTQINCASPERFWIGTPTGLARLNPRTGVLDRPWPAGTGPSQLPGGNVTSIAQDAKGRLWVTFYGFGVCLADQGADGQPGPTRCLGNDQGLLDNAVNALALDQAGNAWVSTDSGLLRIDGGTLKATPLQQADGVGLLAHWAGSVATTQEGDILFGGDGLTIVRPADFSPWRHAAPLVLTEIDGAATAAKEIRLAPSVRSVQLGFALLDYSAPDLVRYAYRLKGLEEAWTDASADSRMARYTNIPPGRYAFEVKARNRVGQWTTAQWPLEVEPRWHETRHARLGAAAAVLLLLWSMVRLRLRMVERRAALLRDQVAQRTQELQQRTEQLEASRQALRELGLHNARLVEDERKRVARELHDELGQQLAAMRMEVSVMKRRSESGQLPSSEQWQFIHDRVDRVTASMRGLVAGLRPPALDGGLSAALQWLAAEHTRTAGTPCSVEVDPQERELAPEVKTMIFRVAQESLNNVLRHAQAGQVRLELTRDERGWDLRVSDDGIGFNATVPTRGFGLLSMEERSQLVGGALTVHSRPGKGTCVHLHIPAGAAGPPKSA